MVKHAHSRRARSLRLARTGSDEKDDEDVKGEEKTGKAGKRKKGERKSQEGKGKDLEEVATNLEQEGRGGTETEMTK